MGSEAEIAHAEGAPRGRPSCLDRVRLHAEPVSNEGWIDTIGKSRNGAIHPNDFGLRMANSATIVTAAWAGDTETTLVFPDSWDVVTCGPVDAPKATRAEIETAFNNPIGSQTISDLARGRESAAIIVDDLSRPTPASEILPFVLNQLSDAGMLSDNIRIVVGGGSHRPITKEEIAQKVGPIIASSYSVSNHDFLSGDLRGLGSLPSGLPIYLNAVVADSDLKLCVGGIYPHGSAGFGGGAKLIVPGIAGFATMFYFPYLLSWSRPRHHRAPGR